MYLQEIHTRLQAVRLFSACTPDFFRFLHRTDQDIFRRMLHIDKLKHLHLIAGPLQHRRTQAISEKRCHPFFEKPIFQHRPQYLISDLTVQLVLTARNREDRLCIPCDCLGQRIIRCCIACMQRHHKIYLIGSLIVCDIAVQEFQLLIPKFLCQRVAVSDHILLQVKPRDPQVKSLLFMQIVIHCKGQIRLSASKIDHRDLPVPAQHRADILDKFQKTVDLAEFIILCLYDLPFHRHHAKLYKKRHRLTFRKQILFRAVVTHVCLRHRYAPVLRLHSHFSFFADQHGGGLAHSLCLQLAIICLHPGQHLLYHFFFCIVCMKFFLSIPACRLKSERSAVLHWADPHTQIRLFLSRCA